VRATTNEAALPARGDGDSGGSHRALLGVLLGGLAIIAIAVVLITQVFSSGSSSTPPKPNTVGGSGTPATTTAGGSSTKPAATVDRAGTQVAVLNGTTVTGLARGAADKLTAAGYKKVGPVTTDTSNQARPSTIIFYEPSARAAAIDAAKVVGLARSALQPMDQNTRVLGQNAPVVVIVGADQAR